MDVLHVTPCKKEPCEEVCTNFPFTANLQVQLFSLGICGPVSWCLWTPPQVQTLGYSRYTDDCRVFPSAVIHLTSSSCRVGRDLSFPFCPVETLNIQRVFHLSSSAGSSGELCKNSFVQLRIGSGRFGDGTPKMFKSCPSSSLSPRLPPNTHTQPPPPLSLRRPPVI